MTKGRIVLIAAQLIATFLFISGTRASDNQSWLAWALPLIVLLLIVVNSFWFSRFVAWLIFAAAFFGFLICLSAFTLRWRLEPGFHSWPFYRSILMYIAMVYVSLAQIKILGGGSVKNENSTNHV